MPSTGSTSKYWKGPNMITIPFSTPRAIAHTLCMNLTTEELAMIIDAVEHWRAPSNAELAS